MSPSTASPTKVQPRGKPQLKVAHTSKQSYRFQAQPLSAHFSTRMAAPKHEAKHRAQGLHLWYTGAAATAADAERAVAQLQADPDVARAELDQEVQLL